MSYDFTDILLIGIFSAMLLQLWENSVTLSRTGRKIKGFFRNTKNGIIKVTRKIIKKESKDA